MTMNLVVTAVDTDDDTGDIQLKIDDHETNHNNTNNNNNEFNDNTDYNDNHNT